MFRELTPVPWVPELIMSKAHVGQKFTADDLRFIETARKAYDVMVNRGWFPEPQREGGWRVYAPCWMSSIPPKNSWEDPFTALVEADRLYRERSVDDE